MRSLKNIIGRYVMKKHKKRKKISARKKPKRQKKVKKDTFYKVATDLIDLIEKKKNELKILKNEELRKLNINEEEQIRLIKERIGLQRQRLIERYERKKEDLGKALLMKKKEKLGKQIVIERKSLSRTNREISKAKKDQKKLKKSGF